MFATFSCASAASGILGKNVRKSLYWISACCNAVVPPSAYHESATASFARATNSESGYVLISVCSVIRATSKRLCFMASMARSNSTLSGCFDPTLASGFTDFLLVHATVSASSNASRTKLEFRRIKNLCTNFWPLTSAILTPAANSRSAPLREAPAHSLSHRPCQTPHSPPPRSPPRRAQPPPPCPFQRRHLLRCGTGIHALPESRPASLFYAAFPGETSARQTLDSPSSPAHDAQCRAPRRGSPPASPD